jgi:hypothetical protein
LLDELLGRPQPTAHDDRNGADAAAIAVALWQATRSSPAPAATTTTSESAWKREGRRKQQEPLP